MTEADEIRRRRAELRRQYGVAHERLSNILFSEDPVGINFEENTDEYEPEVGTILPRLRECRSAEDVRRVVHEEFVKWFDVSTAGPSETYESIAMRVWNEVIPQLTDDGCARKRFATMYAGHEPDIEAEITFRRTEDGGRERPAQTGYRAQFFYHGEHHDAVHEYDNQESISPGRTAKARLHFLHPELLNGLLQVGDCFEIREGDRVVANGFVTAILNLTENARA